MISELSLKNFSPILNFYGRLAFWLYVLLLLTKFSLIGAGLTVLVVFAQVFIGIQLLSSFRVTDKLSALSRVGLGFCLGAILSTLVYVLVVTVTAVYVAVCSQFVLLCLAYFAQRRFSKTDQMPIEPEEIAVVKWLAVTALVGLSPEWFWPLPVAVLLALIFVVYKRIRTHNIGIRALSLVIWSVTGVYVWLQILTTRPNRPWFPDDRFAEIWSFSLGKWGISHNPALIGEGISYHWLSFAWVGLLSNLTLTEVNQLMPLFAPVVIAVACSVIGFTIIKSFVSNYFLAICALILAFAVDTQPLFRGFGFHAFQVNSFSQFFSFFIGLAFVSVFCNIPIERFNSLIPIFIILNVGIVGSKISSGFVTLFGLLGIVTVLYLWTLNVRSSVIFLAFAITVPGVLSAAFFFGSGSAGAGMRLRRPSWPTVVSGGLVDLYNGPIARYLLISGLMVVTLGGYYFWSMMVLVSLRKSTSELSVLFFYFSFMTFAVFFQMIITQGRGVDEVVRSDDTIYAFQYLVSISLLLGVGLLAFVFENQRLFSIAKIWFLCIAVLGALSVYVSNNWTVTISPSYFVYVVEYLRESLPFWSVLIVFLLLKAIGNVVPNLIKSSLLTLGLFSLLASSLVLSLVNMKDISNRQNHEWRSLDRVNEISLDYLLASNWLRLYSSTDEIVATSNFTRNQELSRMTKIKEFAGSDATPKLVGLRSLDDAKKRNALKRFNDWGSCASSQSLQDYGVSYFFIDLTNFDSPDIRRCADEIYRNSTVVIYSLSQLLDR